jgi:hypothetical protein
VIQRQGSQGAVMEWKCAYGERVGGLRSVGILPKPSHGPDSASTGSVGALP